MSYPRFSQSSSSSTEALLAPQKPQKDYWATVAALQNGIGITGQSPLVPNPAANNSKASSGSPGKPHFWSRKEKSEKSQPQPKSESTYEPKVSPLEPMKPNAQRQMSREEALVLLMDKYGMASVQMGGRHGRM